MFQPRRRSALVPILAVLVPVALVLGLWLGGHPQHLPGFARDVFVGDDQEAVFREGLGVLSKDYYRKVPKDKLVNQGLEGAVASLHDRFSHYFDPKAYRQFNEATGGSFSGIGVTVQGDKLGLKVVGLIGRSPAAKAGIKPHDVIVTVDGKALKGKPETVASSLIKGTPGTTVHLVVVRRGRRKPIDVERAKITTPVVTSKLLRTPRGKVGDIHLTTFAVSGAHAQVAQAIRKLRHEGAKGFVFDLRDNGGGLLDEAVLVGSLFIKDGTIVTTDGRARPKHVYRALGDDIAGDAPLVVLMNRGTASASEIVAGAIQDRHRGKLVGTHSFGKGVFQEVKQLSNGGALDITVGEFFLPSGRNLGGGGVKEGAGLSPNVPVANKPHQPGDEQLKAALRTIAPELK